MHLCGHPMTSLSIMGALTKMTTKLKHAIIRLLHCNIFEYVSFSSCEDVHHFMSQFSTKVAKLFWL